MSKVKCFTYQKTSNYASQCPSKKKGKGKKKVAVLAEDDEEFAAGFANEFSLASYLLGTGISSTWLEDNDAWVVDSGASSHMTGMRSVLLSVSETDSNYYVRCGACTMHSIKGVRTVVFQLESKGSLEVAGVMHVPKLKISLLSISTLKDVRYAVMFRDKQVLIRPEGAGTLGEAVRLSPRQGMSYRLSGQPVCGLMLVTEGEQGTLKNEVIQFSNLEDRHDIYSSIIKTSWYELTSLDAQQQVELPRSMLRRNRSSNQSTAQVEGRSSGLKGATTVTNDVMGSR